MVRTPIEKGMTMGLARWTTAMGLGALCVAGALVAPALQAQENNRAERSYARRHVLPRGGIGTFTPAAADPKLAAILARSGLGESGFRFTPSESRRSTGKAVTLAIRARSARTART